MNSRHGLSFPTLAAHQAPRGADFLKIVVAALRCCGVG
jgi:hypothetical protein